MLRPAIQPRLVDGRCEQFGQRAAGCFLPAGPTGKVHVGIHCEAHAGKHQLLRQHLLTVQTHGLGQPQPGFDATLLTRRAIVVDDALNPLAAGVAVRAVGHDRCILHRDAGLIVEAVGDPTLNLFARRLPGIHGPVERVMDMVVLALGAQRLFEFGGTHGWQVHNGFSSFLVVLRSFGLWPAAAMSWLQSSMFMPS